jgi:glycosyltransferase involved in cell wall biosynthesis
MNAHMSQTPAISLVTPVWNGLPYVKETVESVLSQEFQDWEMIIGDNCSTDGTSEYLKSLTDPRIKVFRHDQNLGVYRNIYFVINKASAPIFMGLAADDYLYPGALRKILDAWKHVGPETALISFSWKRRQIHQNQKGLPNDPVQQFCYSALPRKLAGLDSTLAFFLFGNIPGNLSEISGRVSVVAPEHPLYHIKFSADYEYWLRITKKYALHLSDEEVGYIRRHDATAATYMITKGEYHAESYELYEKLINELSAHYDRNKLIAFYNLQNCSYHLRDAIKSALFGKFTALKSFLNLKSPIFWRFQFLRLLPFALSERLRFILTVRLADDILKTANIKPDVQIKS